jgi:phosphomannomutase
VVFTIAGVSPAGSTEYTILASAAITGTGLTVLRVSPHLTAAANTIAKDILPAAIKVTATHADTDSITYEVRFVGTPC